MAILYAGHGDTPRGPIFEIPDRIDSAAGRRYDVGDRIAAGGNGVVHRCADMASGDDFAVKFQLDLRSDRRRRFLRERELLSSLNHDHLMLYEDHGQVVGQKSSRGPGSHGQRQTSSCELPFLVMALANCDLKSLVAREAVPAEVYFAQFRGLAMGLGALHQHAVHRDIKPENILVIGDRWVISDYGLCDPHSCAEDERLTPDWAVVGPRYWMSPEANNRSIGRADAINAGSDVFQLASVFWFVVNRSHPTGVLDRSDWSGPEALFEPIFKALHYNPSTRPIDGAAFASTIEHAILGG